MKTLEIPWDCKEIQPVNRKGDQLWIFIWKTDAEAESLILWPPDAKNWFIGKDPAAGRNWRQEEKGKTEDEIVAWHHRLGGHEFQQSPAIGYGQRSLSWCIHGVTNSQTWLSNWGELSINMEKVMAVNPSILAWKIQWTEEYGRLQYKGLQRVRQDWTHRHINFISLSELTLNR